ncbi:hypothetical protein PROFUN_02840, partial [Planoprotostelium fungivorum]
HDSIEPSIGMLNTQNHQVLKLLATHSKTQRILSTFFSQDDFHSHPMSRDIVKMSLSQPGVSAELCQEWWTTIINQFGHRRPQDYAHHDLMSIINLFLRDPRVNPTEGGLVFATRYNFCKMITRLLEHPKLQEKSVNEAILVAATFDLSPPMRILLTAPNSSAQATSSKALRRAFERGNVGVFTLLLGDKRYNPLHIMEKETHRPGKNVDELMELMRGDQRVMRCKSIRKWLNEMSTQEPSGTEDSSDTTESGEDSDDTTEDTADMV